ncbi:hypothetical protein PRUPE_7G112000 [Prunus persica]|uniref:Late embryogenesis abundant protein LEA-2 subgroup domain-containing protein n=1 Tax=Prunus persica TaxID=3760 RepID=M5W4F5_PRUPE|nr:NDR1/HIN1-like protein 10 [Prunus persica]ONH96186.1 hypothetical protein PRUPE_7G112000 [Prunus persica]
MRNGRQSRWCNFSCFFWIFYYSILAFILFIVAIIIFWLIFQPQELKFTVTDASLTQFNLTNTSITNTTNNTLYYNLALNVSIRNPNKKVGVYYNRIQAIGNYGKKRFALVNTTSTPFYQGHKNTTMVRFVLQGQQVVVLGGKELSRFNSETSARVYNIDVKLAQRIKARYGKIKTAYFKPPKVDCQLKLPLSTIYNNGTSVGPKFVSKECGSVKIFTISVGIGIGPFSFETG